MNQTKLIYAFVICSLLSFGISKGVTAAETGSVRVGGFFSTSTVLTDNQTPYTNRAGYSDNLDFSSDTVVGVQLNFQANEDFSFTTQMIGRGSGVDSQFETSFEWLFATYQARDNVSVRIGRLRFPNYLISKTLDVGLT